MPEVWAVIVGAIVLLILYGVVSSKLKARRQRKAREKVLPFVEETVRAGQSYNVILSDGRKFMNVNLLGTSRPESGVSVLGDWEGLLVLQLSTGKKAYVKQSAIRCLEEV
jgi:hypothetical protein